jgi:KipI family sensor histidine kinase inhibitor
MSRVAPYGDSAVLVDVDDVASALWLATAIDEARRARTSVAGIEDAVIGFHSVVVHVDPAAPLELVEQWLSGLVTGAGAGRHAAGRQTATTGDGPRRVDIAVTFDGPDLAEVAADTGCTVSAVVEQLCRAELQVAFVGFAPGFPYLVGLPPELASVRRRTSPRPSVPAGSVAVGGGFASVYPRATPGGWRLLGRTGTRLFDPEQPPYALLRPGDRVRFSVGAGDREVETPADAARPVAPPRPTVRATGHRFIEVLDPGLLSLVEDGGRRSVTGLGVPRAGPADPATMRLANRLVGNPDGCAAIEVTASGPTLRVSGDAHLGAVASYPDGLEVRIDGYPVGADVVVPVRHGQVVTVGRIRRGLRAYVAVSGGIETPLVVGSRSTDLLSGLGLGPLMAGDQLDLGPPSRPHGQLSPPLEAVPGDRPTVIQVLAGPQRPRSSEDAPLAPGPWTVGDASNRIGLRLSGHGRPPSPGGAEIPPTGMITGAIQLPPDGNPIILMPDHATTGGYRVVACVIAADLPLLGQLGPGDTVTFTAVDRPAARRWYLERERLLAARVTGWFPTEAAT